MTTKALTALITLCLAGGCGPATVDDSPIAVVADRTAPSVPVLPTEAAKAPTAAEEQIDLTPPATPDPPPPPAPAGDADFLAVPVSVPADVRPELGSVFTLVRVMSDDPGRAGIRGDELLNELRRILEEPRRINIDQTLGKIRQWSLDNELNQEVAEFAKGALRQARTATSGGNGNAGNGSNGNGNGGNDNGRGGDNGNDDHDGG